MERLGPAKRDPKCTMCGWGYDPEFMTGLPCRLYRQDDTPRPGCPPQQEDMRRVRAEVSGKNAAPTSGGCLLVLLTLLLAGVALVW
ncbi:hypothetical protein AN216_21885 [Streptomyces oceani]|uniref:Uncharacterized protein n=2 Tax=Streptomyces oceani TaxID=1075402 RepID=A0A1E7JX07_9ACTN|nr:hypothetical protein AN216_21885 [Streptomyces oceani]